MRHCDVLCEKSGLLLCQQERLQLNQALMPDHLWRSAHDHDHLDHHDNASNLFGCLRGALYWWLGRVAMYFFEHSVFGLPCVCSGH